MIAFQANVSVMWSMSEHVNVIILMKKTALTFTIIIDLHNDMQSLIPNVFNAYITKHLYGFCFGASISRSHCAADTHLGNENCAHSMQIT